MLCLWFLMHFVSLSFPLITGAAPCLLPREHKIVCVHKLLSCEQEILWDTVYVLLLTHAHQKCNDLSFVPLSPQGLCTVLGSLGIRIVPQFDRTIILTLNVWKEVMFGWYNFLFCQAEWEKVFSEASLNLVAVRKSFYGSALFLCRCPSPSKKPVFLPVESTDYKWVETLKVSSITFWMCLPFKCQRVSRKNMSKWQAKGS